MFMKSYQQVLRIILVLPLLNVCNLGIIRAQRKLSDNLGNHIAIKDLNLSNKNINNVKVVNTDNLIIGTGSSVTNQSIALQVNGSDQAILIPRVTDLLNVTAPSIPVANAVEGMMVYDVATHKLYIRDNSAWVTYGWPSLSSGQILIGNSSGIAQPRTVTGDITLTNTGVTTIGAGKVITAMLADQSVTASKISSGSANQYLKTNPAGNAVVWGALDLNKYVDLISTQNLIKGHKTFVSDTGFVAGGTLNSGILPVTTTGVRMMWYPKKAAFNAGNLIAANIIDANIGLYSAAFGNGSIASGESSMATGRSTASGLSSSAFGNSIASGSYTTAGGNSSATNFYATALGAGSTATGSYDTSIGSTAKTSGGSSLALGNTVTSGGYASVAIGTNIVNPGNAYLVTLADGSTNTLVNSTSGQLMTRFAGGYRFFTNNTSSTGVMLLPGGTSWSAISDKRKKENFIRVNGEDLLSKIDTLYLGSWNYKGQSPELYRHYGPMAQDFYQAFGKDSLGKIGNDTTIAGADIDGVILIGVQALNKRLNVLAQKQNSLSSNQAAAFGCAVSNSDKNNEAVKMLNLQIDDFEKALNIRMRKNRNNKSVSNSKKTAFR
jgi:hypothetical protein